MSDINFLTEDFSENGFFYNNGYGWNPIQSFSGNLNGNGFSINNLKILKPNTSGLSGLFSNLSNAVIKNITFNNFNIKFSSRDIYDLRTYAGIIAGKSNNSKYVNIIINNSSINADYSYSGGYAGSIVGYDEQSNFSNCSNNNVTLGSNSSISYLGGIVGYSLYGTYNNIISKAYLGGKFIVGGIVGKNKYGTFINLQSMKPTSSTSTNASHGGGLIGELTEGTLLSSVNNINAGSSPIVHEFVSRVYDSLVMDLYMPNTNYSSGIGFGYSSNNYLKNIYKGKGTVFVSSSNNDYIRNIYVPLNFSTYKDNIFPEINGSNIAYVTSSINQVCYYFDCNNIWENIDNNINLRMTNYDFEKENIHVVYGNTININSYPFNQMETDDYEVMNSNASIATIDVNNRTLTANNYGTTNITLTSKIGSKFSKEYEINVVDYINVENVLLNKDKVSLLKGENETLELTIIPTEAMNKNVTWESSNENVAIVDENGKITAVSRGTATITVISEDGEKKDTCEVTVKEPKITLGDKNINSNYDSTLYAGYGGTIIVPITTQDIEENSKLTLKYYKDDVEMTNTEFSEAFKIGGNVVTDNKVNLQIGVMASTLKGKYKIEVSTENAESKSFEFEVIPPILVEDIEANDIILIINQNIKVNYKITNDNAMNKKVSFSIRNKDESLTTLIATIDEQGVITANQIGEGILTIEAKDGSGVKKEINLTIIDDFDIKTAKYVIDENLNIHKIKDKLVLEDFIKDFEVNSNIIAKIYKNDSEIDYTKPLGTGYKLKTYSNEELINEYTLIVSGDLNGDGNANATDILAQKLHILNKTQLKEEYFTAGDINEDGKVNATDILYIKMYILEKYSTVWGK